MPIDSPSAYAPQPMNDGATIENLMHAVGYTVHLRRYEAIRSSAAAQNLIILPTIFSLHSIDSTHYCFTNLGISAITLHEVRQSAERISRKE